MRIHSCSENLCISTPLILHDTSACSAREQTADHPDNNGISYCCKEPQRENLSNNTSECQKVAGEIMQVMVLPSSQLRLHNMYSDTPPPRCSAWTMFSVHAHYRKCKRLTEFHSQGYCLYPLLAVHLHGADQALKHNLPQKKTTQPAAIFKPGSLHRQGIATEISKDLQCKWVAQISFSLLMIS